MPYSRGVNEPRHAARVEVLLEALPYIQRFAGKTVVVKLGGNAMIDRELEQAFALDIVLLRTVGLKPVVVHGGGPQIDRMLEELAIPSTFVRGLRVTDARTMRVVEMVLAGEINGEIVARIQSVGGRAVGLSGKDGGLLRARRKTSTDGSDLGQVGEVEAVDAGVIEALHERGFIPVIAPVAAGATGESLNVNADTAAGEIAAALGAERLLLLTDVEGILDRDGRLMPTLHQAEARGLIASGVVGGGMIPKLECCLDAIEGGVGKVHVIDGRVPHSVLLELFTDAGIGTEVAAGGMAAQGASGVRA